MFVFYGKCRIGFEDEKFRGEKYGDCGGFEIILYPRQGFESPILIRMASIYVHAMGGCRAWE